MDLGITTYVFLTLNCILLIIGLIRIVVGISFIVSSVFVYFGAKYVTFSTIIGDAAFLGLHEGAVFLLGTLAGLKNNIRLLFTFLFLVILLSVLKIFSLNETRQNEIIIREDVRLFLEDLMNEYRIRRGQAENVDYVQNMFHCCGLDGPQFWSNITDTSTNTTSDNRAMESILLPNSCCSNRELVCVAKNAWKSGCLSSVNSRIPKLLIDIHYYTSYPVLEILLFVFGSALIVFIKKTAAKSLA